MRAPTFPQLRLFSALLALLFIAFPVGLHAGDKKSLKGVALVIGQSNYEHIAQLPNPANDARAMVKLLSDLGFDARSVSDRDAKKLKRDLERFVEDAEGADVAFLYYSGHGIESGGENWLVPVDADVSSLDHAEDSLVPLSSVMDALKGVVPVTIVLLDACRTNPFPAGALVRKTPEDAGAPISAGGLTPMRGAATIASADQPASSDLGTVIGFAAEPGRPALDGSVGGNSPYAAALLRHLSAMDGLEFGQVMRMVTEEVYLDTKTRQRPWVNESMMRLLYFGVPQPAPTGEDGMITGERRQLLLTISDLSDVKRVQVETVAAKDGVPLDALYGILRALGTDKMPEDPTELEKLLDAQAERLKAIIAEREALRTDDPEIKRLMAAADRAIDQGAIVTARQFLDEAVKRVEETRATVDAAEEAVKKKRIADAAIYARRAKVSSLGFDYLAAAADYRKAYELVERWDDKLRANYKSWEGQMLRDYGETTADGVQLEQALAAYREVLSLNALDSLEWATTRNDMAAVMQVIGERSSDTRALAEAAEMLREALSIFEQKKAYDLWAIAEGNLGGILLAIGQRNGDAKMLQDAVAAMRAAQARRDRSKAPLDWAITQTSIGDTLFQLSKTESGPEKLVEAEAAYRQALEAATREKDPAMWAAIQNNLGITLDDLALARNDPALLKEANAVFRAALEVRTRKDLPLWWARTQLNLAANLNYLARYETGTGSLEEARTILEDALTVLTRQRIPLEWAAAENNLGSVLQLIGQRTFDAAKFEESAAAFRAALREYPEAHLPIDYAETNYNLGNSLHLAGSIRSDAGLLHQAIDAYGNALRHYSRTTTPQRWALAQSYLGSTLQSLATVEGDPMINWQRAVGAQRAALEVLTRDNAPVDWANAQSWMGQCLLNLGSIGRNPALLAEAKAAFEAAEAVQTREVFPLQWAGLESSIGAVHAQLAYQGGDPANYSQALERFEGAKTVYVNSGYAPMAAVLDQQIALVKKATAPKQ
jgi:uncharacterized caspase-like protein